MVYPDLTVLLSLLAPGELNQEASILLRSPGSAPLTLSIVHRLQVENSLLRYRHGSDTRMRTNAGNGLLLWQEYVEEGIFEFRPFPLSEAFAQAVGWNAESTSQPPRWHLLIHVALAATQSASFMSLDPALRKRASKAGLALIPPKL
jgi:hypothetical protein